MRYRYIRSGYINIYILLSIIVMSIVLSMNRTMQCTHCGYEWTPRLSTRKPKRCPRCVHWLEDWRNKDTPAAENGP